MSNIMTFIEGYMTGNAIMNVSENISQTHVSVCVGRISGGAEMKLAM